MLPETTTRVSRHTASRVNARIARQIEENVMPTAAGGREAIARRLAELDREWDIERTLEANAATVSLTGLMLGATVDRRWFILPAVVAGFLLQKTRSDGRPVAARTGHHAPPPCREPHQLSRPR
jgi:hypothetical protein